MIQLLETKQAQNKNKYNKPVVSEICAIYNIEEGSPTDRDIIIYARTPQGKGQFHRLNLISPNLLPMTYPLLFPSG